MNTRTYQGNCQCGNISIEVALSLDPEAYNPRACDCDFCCRYEAAYVSDPAGKLTIEVADNSNLVWHKQGGQQADFLICGGCDCLMAACYEKDGVLYASVNGKAIADTTFGKEVPVSPKLLDAAAKSQRWQKAWFSHVIVKL